MIIIKGGGPAEQEKSVPPLKKIERGREEEPGKRGDCGEEIWKPGA